MKKLIHAAALFLVLLNFSCFADNSEELITFTPPSGWKSADLEKLSPVIKLMLIGTGKDHFPPSLTLAVEPYKGTLKDYLNIVKKLNHAEKTEWKDLGKIQTKAGSASLSQFDEKSNWGSVRTMTAILVKNDNAYILSATALQSEFSSFYKDFFNAMKSLDITLSAKDELKTEDLDKQ